MTPSPNTDRRAGLVALAPCPFCGGSGRLTGAGYRGPADCYDVAIECDDCNAIGPSSQIDLEMTDDANESEREAVEEVTTLWNTRARAAQDNDGEGGA